MDTQVQHRGAKVGELTASCQKNTIVSFRITSTLHRWVCRHFHKSYCRRRESCKLTVGKPCCKISAYHNLDNAHRDTGACLMPKLYKFIPYCCGHISGVTFNKNTCSYFWGPYQVKKTIKTGKMTTVHYTVIQLIIQYEPVRGYCFCCMLNL